MTTTLLVACSKTKSNVARARAQELYTGKCFKAALSIAKKNNWRVRILSAKYGFIEPEAVIENYDLKREIVYTGEYPEGNGYYTGGILYFARAPDRFKPLLRSQGLGFGFNLSELLILEKSDAVKFPADVAGAVDFIAECLLTGPRTKPELIDLLLRRFAGTVESDFVGVVNSQLMQERIGDQNSAWLQATSDGTFFLQKMTLSQTRVRHRNAGVVLRKADK